MSCPLENKNIYVTSANRDTEKYPYGNSYTLYLTTPIKDITTVELLYASVPNTMYNLNNGSQVIGFTDKAGNPGVVMSNIASGFYSSCTLATAVYNATSFASEVTVSFLGGEGKFLFTRATPFTMTIATAELAALMGFDYPFVSQPAVDSRNTPYVNDVAFSTQKYFIKSKYVIEMNPIDGVFLDIQELRTMYNECAPVGSPCSAMLPVPSQNPQSPSFFANSNRSFGMIPMDVSSGFIKRFKKSTDYDLSIRYPYPIQKLDRLTVNWIDRNGNPVNFNGADINSFILRFHTLRKNMC
jgi:hypothetical protein